LLPFHSKTFPAGTISIAGNNGGNGELSAFAKTLTTPQRTMHKFQMATAPWSVSHAAVLHIHAVKLGAMLCTRSQVAQPCMAAHPTTAAVATPAMAGMLVT
jgi:hypothetical protein